MGWLGALIERHNPRTNPYHFDFTSRMLRTVFVMLVLFLALFFAFRSSPAFTQETTSQTYNLPCSDAGMQEANARTYGPGDVILLERGCTYNVGLDLGPDDSGVTVDATGSGELPKIDPFQDAAVEILNTDGVTLRNFHATNHGYSPKSVDRDGKDVSGTGTPNMKDTVHVIADGTGPSCGAACTIEGLTIENLVVSGDMQNHHGINLIAGRYQTDLNRYGFINDVLIQNVESYGHHFAGLNTIGTFTENAPTYPIKNLRILNSHFYDNGGDGVVVGMAENVLIEGNEANHNGSKRNARLGLWTWESKDVVFQFNESHHNTTPLNGEFARDGGGFDCDLGAVNCLIQYNYSHDNKGEGYLLMQYPVQGTNRGVSKNLHMRYNISERDAKGLAGAIEVFGGPKPITINNNVVYYEPARGGSAPQFEGPGGAIATSTWSNSGAPTASVFNNLFIMDTSKHPNAVGNFFRQDGKGTWVFNNNAYYRLPNQGFRADVNRKVKDTFAKWRNLGFDGAGFNTNPQIVGVPGSGPSAYDLGSSSPVIDKGRVVTSGYGTGDRDYAGNPAPSGAANDGTPIPQGANYDAGAYEWVAP